MEDGLHKVEQDIKSKIQKFETKRGRAEKEMQDLEDDGEDTTHMKAQIEVYKKRTAEMREQLVSKILI